MYTLRPMGEILHFFDINVLHIINCIPNGTIKSCAHINKFFTYHAYWDATCSYAFCFLKVIR